MRDLLTDAGRRVLDDLHARDQAERDAGVRRPESLMALAPAVAELLFVLAVQRRALTVAEFGTSHGFSTIHLAAAAALTGGHVHSVDTMPEKTERARQNLRDAGLADRVTLVTADGAAFAAGLPAGVDLVLVDYPVPAFLPALDVLRPRLAPGCLIFADGGPDGHWHTGGGRPLREALEADRAFLVSLIPLHREELVAVRLPEAV